MNPVSICESGTSTKILQEPFSMKFELTDFDIQETYTASNDGTLRRVITFTEQTSSPQVIGQSIGFPSSWCVSIRCVSSHARVALKFKNYFRDNLALPRSNGQSYAVLKFRINIVDKDGDLLYEKRWQSWECPKRINLTEDYAMMDYIPLEELFDSQNFLMPDKTMRVLCEGVLYSGFVQTPISFGKQITFSAIPKPYFIQDDEFCDVKLVAETGKGFKAHKLILSQASPILRGLLPTMNKDEHERLPSLQLEELTEYEISKMIDYIYTGDIKSQDWSNYQEIEKLIKISKNYELMGLKWLCFDNLVSTMKLSNFPEIAKILFKNSVEPEIRAILNRFYMKNQDKLIQMDSFKKFAIEEKDAFLYVILWRS